MQLVSGIGLADIMNALPKMIVETLESEQSDFLRIGEEDTYSISELKNVVEYFCAVLLQEGLHERTALFSIDTNAHSICFLLSALILRIPIVQVREAPELDQNLPEFLKADQKYFHVGFEVEHAIPICSEPFELELAIITGRQLEPVCLREIIANVQDSGPLIDSAAIIQLTSGTTGTSKGIVLTEVNIVSNLLGIAQRTGMKAKTDSLASWLPLHHDMGLMSLLLCFLLKIPLFLVKPQAFVRNPTAWFDRLCSLSITCAIMPSLGLRLTQRHARKMIRGNLDLSKLRYVMVGSDMTYHDMISEFEQAFECLGLKKGAIKPAYGLAENVVAVSAHSEDQIPTWLDVLLPERGIGHAIESTESDSEGVVRLISVGSSVSNTNINIMNDDKSLPDRYIGEIAINGSSTSLTTFSKDGVQSRKQNDWLLTGDLGFMLGQDLYIIGRKANLIKILGKSYSSESIEQHLKTHLGIQSCVLMQCHNFDSARDEVIIFLDRKTGDILRSIAESTDKPTGSLLEIIRRETLKTFGFKVDSIMIKQGRFPQTSSGKIIRRELQQQFLLKSAQFELWR